MVYKACVLGTLLYGSETWTMHSRHERKLNTFHMRNLRRILSVTWQDRVTNAEVLSRAGVESMYTLLRQRRLRWLGHVRRMEDGRIPKDILYGELRSGLRRLGRPHLRYKDVCKRDMKAINIDPNAWEQLAADRPQWRYRLKQHLKRGEEELHSKTARKRDARKLRATVPVATTYRCTQCGRVCHSRIGLQSHTRRCRRSETRQTT